MRRGYKGQSIVEMALLLPVLLLLAVGMVDLGRAFYFQETIANAAREGARFGAINNVTEGAISAQAVAEVGSLPGVSATALRTSDPGLPGKYVEVTVTYQFALITPLIQNVIGLTSIPLSARARQPQANSFASSP